MDIRKANVYGGRKVTRQMYTCDHGEFTKAPKGYYRIEVVVLVGTVFLALCVAVLAVVAFTCPGVTL